MRRRAPRRAGRAEPGQSPWGFRLDLAQDAPGAGSAVRRGQVQAGQLQHQGGEFLVSVAH